LPEYTGRKRLLHIHHHVAGVLAQVNKRLAASGVDILAQYLSTNEDVGYVVIDIDQAVGKSALAQLCTVPATIRCHTLY